MATYVLVHGAWSGAHSYRAVRPLLQAAGHDVFSPSLTGLGDRVHLVSPQVGLSTHVSDVVNLVRHEDLRDIVLVGHSYGGMVVTGAAELVGDRIRHLVYLDAFVPRNGQSLNDLTGQQARDGEPPLDVAWLVPPPEREYDSPEEAAWAKPRRHPHPAACFREPVALRRPVEEHDFALTYIKATADPDTSPGATAFWAAADHARAHPRWGYHEIATNHMVQHNEPAALATFLLTLT